MTIYGVVRLADSFAQRAGSLLLLVITLFLPPVVYADTRTEIKGTDPPGYFGMVDTAPVVVNGKVRFQVVGVSAYPAKRRADEIARRIEALAKDPTFNPGTLRIEDGGSVISSVIAGRTEGCPEGAVVHAAGERSGIILWVGV